MTTAKTQDAPRGKVAAEARRKALAPRVAELLAQGASNVAIGRQLGISHSTVARIIGEMNDTPATRPGGIHPKQEQIVELAEAGLAQKKIAKQLNVSNKTVGVTLRRLGLTGTPGRRVDPEALARAKAFLEDRAGYAEASRSTGVAIEALKLHFPGMGLTRSEVGLLGWPLRRIANRAAANGIDLVPLSRVRGA